MAYEIKYKVLIYDNIYTDIKKLIYFCKQFGMHPFFAESKKQAEEMIENNYFELAIINCQIERITVNNETKIIITSEISSNLKTNILKYHYSSLLPKPLVEHFIVYQLINVSGLKPETQSFPCNYVKLSSLLRETDFFLSSLMLDDQNSLNFIEIAKKYCINECEFAKCSEDLISEDTSLYSLLTEHSNRGPLYCKFKKECNLFRLSDYYNDLLPQYSKGSMLEFLKKTPFNKQETNFIEANKLLTNQYILLSEKATDAKTKFCDTNCHSFIDQFKSNKKVRKFCCDYGCVLDSYFELTPKIQFLKKYNVLIYENIQTDAKILAHACSQLNIEPTISDNFAEAKKLLRTNTFDFVIMNFELDKLPIPKTMKNIVVGEPRISAVPGIISAQAISFIPKPFDIGAISIGLFKVFNKLFLKTSIPSILYNIVLILEKLNFNLTKIVLDPNSKLNITDSLIFYCQNSCETADTSIDPNETNALKYETLNLASKRGTLYCRFKSKCALTKFTSWVTQRDPGFKFQLITDSINKIQYKGNNFSFISTLRKIINDIDSEINLLYNLKIEYCTTVCDFRKEDLNFKKEDNIFTSMREIVEKNHCIYCAEKNCALDSYFDYFKRKTT